MKRAHLAMMRRISLLLLLPGIAGLILSTAISTHYLKTLPALPVPEQLRMTPRMIDGQVVYQTKEEARRLTAIESLSVTLFAFGAILGLIYLEQWSTLRSEDPEEQALLPDN